MVGEITPIIYAVFLSHSFTTNYSVDSCWFIWHKGVKFFIKLYLCFKSLLLWSKKVIFQLFVGGIWYVWRFWLIPNWVVNQTNLESIWNNLEPSDLLYHKQITDKYLLFNMIDCLPFFQNFDTLLVRSYSKWELCL